MYQAPFNNPYGSHIEPCSKAHVGPIWVPYSTHMGLPIWDPRGALLQNPCGAQMGCPDGTHVVSHVGPIWVPYVLLAGKYL